MRHIWTGLMAGAAITLSMAATAQAAVPPECDPAELARLPKAVSASYHTPADPSHMDDVYANLLARKNKGDSLDGIVTSLAIDYSFDTIDHYGFNLAFVVGIEGRVTCIALQSSYDEHVQPQWNPQRRAWAESVSQWRFRPYKTDNKVIPVVGELGIREYELPETYVPMPDGDPKDVVIIHDMKAFGYHLELHGDGHAIYNSSYPYYFLGPQTYQVDPQAIADLLNEAKDADFWSLRDVYPKNPDASEAYDSRIEITLGGKTKSLTSYQDRHSGIPDSAYFLAYGVRHIVNLDFWWHPTIATIEQLKTNGFDFKSQAAGRYLLQIMGHEDVADDTVLAVMAMGAPTDAFAQTDFERSPQTLLDAALSAGRVKIATQLIAGGMLRTNGKPDQVKIDRAFQAAIESQKIEAFDLIVPYHPALTYPDPEDASFPISLLFKLQSSYSASSEETPTNVVKIVQRLIDMGVDINSRAANGETLLHRLDGDKKTVLFLIRHGADVNALDKQGLSPLVSGYSPERALLLLKHGANPRIGKVADTLRELIELSGWSEVKTWLKTHGYADLLNAPTPRS